MDIWSRRSRTTKRFTSPSIHRDILPANGLQDRPSILRRLDKRCIAINGTDTEQPQSRTLSRKQNCKSVLYELLVSQTLLIFRGGIIHRVLYRSLARERLVCHCPSIWHRHLPTVPSIQQALFRDKIGIDGKKVVLVKQS